MEIDSFERSVIDPLASAAATTRGTTRPAAARDWQRVTSGFGFDRRRCGNAENPFKLTAAAAWAVGVVGNGVGRRSAYQDLEDLIARLAFVFVKRHQQHLKMIGVLQHSTGAAI